MVLLSQKTPTVSDNYGIQAEDSRYEIIAFSLLIQTDFLLPQDLL